uniref:Uncharacterized protein n=1 Tax=Arundo donax TaxID=35708 RepID=A0A0A9BXP2_ARUDO
MTSTNKLLSKKNTIITCLIQAKICRSLF